MYYVHVNSIKNRVKILKLKIKIKKWSKNRNWIKFYVQRKKKSICLGMVILEIDKANLYLFDMNNSIY